MKILGIDTSTGTGGAALVDGALVGEYTLGVGAEHSERLLPAVERLMIDAGWQGTDLAAIAVAVGPGSFTGLRIGVTTAKVLAYVWRKPVVGVNTLEALAWQAAGCQCLVVPALNARRGLVYAAVYRVVDASAAPEAIKPPANLPMAELLQYLAGQDEKVVILGDAATVFASQIAASLGAQAVRLPQVSAMLRPASVASLGEFYHAKGMAEDPFTLLPAYLRKPEAEVKWENAQLMPQ